jgi:predicted DNA-binding protein YlxM (UPF0122 family)
MLQPIASQRRLSLGDIKDQSNPGIGRKAVREMLEETKEQLAHLEERLELLRRRL